MKLYQYDSYESYKVAQIEANKRKLKNSWVVPEVIQLLSDYIYNTLSITPNLILCHGTRRGLEQQYFLNEFKKFHINPTVIGTEISPTAHDFPNTIEWDFHNVKDEWINNVDVVYSNSFDHSYKPEECLDTWMSCVKKDGVCIIEYCKNADTKSHSVDPFGATLSEYISMIEKKYIILDILNNDELPEKTNHSGKLEFIVIKHKN